MPELLQSIQTIEVFGVIRIRLPESHLCFRELLTESESLNRNINHLLKKVFNTAGKSGCAQEPLKPAYEARVAQGMEPSLALLTIARKLAATTLSIWKRGEQYSLERMKLQVA